MRHRLSNGATALPLHESDFLLGISRSSAAIAALKAQGIAYNAFYNFAADRMPVAEFRGGGRSIAPSFSRRWRASGSKRRIRSRMGLSRPAIAHCGAGAGDAVRGRADDSRSRVI
jgi:hypothetical protein